MHKIAHRTGENKGAAPCPSLFSPPALQRKRDRTGELVDDDPPAAVEATGIDPVLDLKMLLTAVRELQRRGAE